MMPMQQMLKGVRPATHQYAPLHTHIHTLQPICSPQQPPPMACATAGWRSTARQPSMLAVSALQFLHHLLFQPLQPLSPTGPQMGVINPTTTLCTHTLKRPPVPPDPNHTNISDGIHVGCSIAHHLPGRRARGAARARGRAQCWPLEGVRRVWLVCRSATAHHQPPSLPINPRV